MAVSDDTNVAAPASIIGWRTDFEWDDDLTGRLSGTRPQAARLREATHELTGHRRRRLIVGIAWIVVSLIIMQLDAASVTTVGMLAGLMFALAAVQNFAMPTLPARTSWVSATFGVLFVIAEILCFVNPTDTGAAMTAMLGVLFGIVGAWWMVEAFLERPHNPLWGTELTAGIVMTALAFWTAGQQLADSASLLLLCTGLWALMQGFIDIARAFAIRR